MMKTILSKTLEMARGTATMMGLAMMLAVVPGVGTTAFAAATGDPFKLGRLNGIDVISTLVGSADGALLRVNNNGSGPALDLRVEPGEAPMNVNSATRVDDLNADRLDGKDSTAFVPTDTYVVQDLGSSEGGGVIGDKTAFCDRGDTLLGGGFDSSADDSVISSKPAVSARSGWSVRFQDNGSSTVIFVTALCADLPPLRP